MFAATIFFFFQVIFMPKMHIFNTCIENTVNEFFLWGNVTLWVLNEVQNEWIYKQDQQVIKQFLEYLEEKCCAKDSERHLCIFFVLFNFAHSSTVCKPIALPCMGKEQVYIKYFLSASGFCKFSLTNVYFSGSLLHVPNLFTDYAANPPGL